MNIINCNSKSLLHQ